MTKTWVEKLLISNFWLSKTTNFAHVFEHKTKFWFQSIHSLYQNFKKKQSFKGFEVFSLLRRPIWIEWLCTHLFFGLLIAKMILAPLILRGYAHVLQKVSERERGRASSSRRCTSQPFETSVWLGMICTRSIKERPQLCGS